MPAAAGPGGLLWSASSRAVRPDGPDGPGGPGGREVKRRTDVVQVLPNDDALLRLVTAVLFELHDEWIAFPRRYLPEGSMDQLYPTKLPESAPALPNTTNTPAD
ncbi:transposase [Streptomyces sp. LS1784]|uniref:transposase n=1 Tax=Streptomyces sp. LS1784 TaxID=2851533 RepID=UPI0035A91FA5